MQTKLKYVSFDDREFNTEQECVDYENRLCDKDLTHLTKEQIVVLLHILFHMYLKVGVDESQVTVRIRFGKDNNDGTGIWFSIEYPDLKLKGVICGKLSIWEMKMSGKDKDGIYIDSPLDAIKYLQTIGYFEQYMRKNKPERQFDDEVVYEFSYSSIDDEPYNDKYELNPQMGKFL